MPTTCLLCCESMDVFLLPPCNHKQICWKCSLKLIEGSTFSCPFCKGIPEGKSCILFVEEQEMKKYTFQQIITLKIFRSAKKSYQFYSNERVANFIEESTSFYCRLCSQIFENVNFLKKHLNQAHSKQFCDVCFENRKCLISQQYLYSEGQLINHLKKGEMSKDGDVILYHPYCDFCKIRFYDIDAFKVHLRLSTHLKCDICEKNFPQFKYVYYRDYDEIEKHFKKTHFMCEIGACVGRKLENVFVSEQTLEEHKNRTHNKFRGKEKPVVNMLLFQANKEEEVEWDGVGKNFSSQFTASMKTYNIEKQEHFNKIIDIREFYPQLVKAGNRLSLPAIRQKLMDFLYRQDYKNDEISINCTLMFTPLEMQSLSRNELEKFIRSIYDQRFADPIITIFFTKKHEYSNNYDFLSEVRRRMWSFSPISYYYVFPQLIRFMKDENPTKKIMDQVYAESLRELKINNQFIFHTKVYYSDILLLLQEQIEARMYDLIFQETIDIKVYKTYLKDLNPHYYFQNQEKMFYVTKEKIVNLYHMVDISKTKELLKLNWLLKVGFTPAAHKIMYDKFYYQTVENSGTAITLITIQELALLYAYVGVCIEAILEKDKFKYNKAHPYPLFLGTIMLRIPKCMSDKDKTELNNLERKSLAISASMNSSVVARKSGFYAKESDHPSLLKTEINLPEPARKEENLFGFTHSSHWNENRLSSQQETKKAVSKFNDEQQYPSLISLPVRKQSETNYDEEQFPVFTYHQKFAKSNIEMNKNKNMKAKIENENGKSNVITELGLFDLKVSASKWDNDEGRQKMTVQLEIEKDRKKQEMAQQQKKEPNEQIQKSTKKKKKKAQEEKMQVKEYERPITVPIADPYEPENIYIKKKKDDLEEEDRNNKKKGKKYKKNKVYEEEPIQKQAVKKQSSGPVQFYDIKPKKKNKVRLDATDSSQEEREKKEGQKKALEQKKKKLAEEERLKQSIRYEEGFDSLLDPKVAGKGESIVNQIANSSRVEVQAPVTKIKMGKKGKREIIETASLTQWK